MTGILNLVTTGVILAETFETYPGNWTFSGSGAGRKSPFGHSGAGAFLLETGGYSWTAFPAGLAAAANSQFQQTVNVGTGANRVCRVFRGPYAGALASVYDDFTVPDQSGLYNAAAPDFTNKWYPTGTAQSSARIANSLLTMQSDGTYTRANDDSTAFTMQNRQIEADSSHGNSPTRISIRCQILDTTTHHHIAFVWDTDGDKIELHFQNDGHVWIRAANSSNYDERDLGTYDTSMHTWVCEWQTGKIWKDGVLFVTATKIPNQTNYHFRFFFNAGGSGGAGGMAVDWVGFYNTATAGTHKARLQIGSQTVFDHDVEVETFLQDGTSGFIDSGWLAVTPTGSQSIILDVHNPSAAQAQCSDQIYWDDLIIMSDKIITIESLLGGQKVELYNAGGGLLATMTCPQAGVNVTTDVSSLFKTAYGLSGYFKVYDTDGVTLLYTTPTLTIWGGDLYQWIPNQSNLAFSTTATQIYRTGSGQTPTTATLTATITDAGTGAGLSGKTIAFTSNLGTCNPAGGTTDSNGNLSTTYTAGAAAGLGGVRADFAGDATYGASSVQQFEDIYYGPITVDGTKDFQVFVEGQELVIDSGNYRLASDFIPQAFSVTTPLLDGVVGGWWAIKIYRLGVLEFSGRILKRSRVGGPNPKMTVSGVDEKIDLQRRVANRVYMDEPKNIITDLLSRYPCGISAGSISTYGATISLPATYTNLFDAFKLIMNITGWKFRLNANLTLDFAPNFGIVQPITIQTGVNGVIAQHDEDWTKIDTKIYVVGSAAAASLVGTASDANAQLTYGLIEEAFLEKALTAQGTVNLRAQQLLTTRTGVIETNTADWIDELATGTYGPFDIVTVIDTDLNLSGGYVISTLQRDLTDAYRAALGLTNRVLTIADAIQEVRKNVQDIGVL
jgi:hypothetical protein